MYATDNGTTTSDYTTLDEELFGDFSGHEDNNPNTSHDNLRKKSQGPSYPHEAATPRISRALAQITSEPGLPPQPVSGFLPTKSHVPSEPMDTDISAPLDLSTPQTASVSISASASSQLIAENISWMKARITDVHQLLLHYINLRNSHNDMAANMQKEMLLRVETKEALERIREQQDQTSEDIPRLQFQIAQLKLDVQNERAARAAAETDMAAINQKLCSYDERFSSMQAQLSDYKERENVWQKEKEILAGRIKEHTTETMRNLGLSPAQGSPTSMKGTHHPEETPS